MDCSKRCVGIDEVKDTHLISLFLQQAPVFRSSSALGSVMTIEQQHCMMFGRAKPLDFPAPEPPTTRMLRHLRCLWVSRLMRKFCVSRMFWEYGFLLYFLQICRASPHLAEPCSSLCGSSSDWNKKCRSRLRKVTCRPAST